MLLIRAMEAPGPINKSHMETAVGIYVNRCASFQVVDVPGNHFVHLNEPNVLSEQVKDFLSKDVTPILAN